MSKSPDTDCSPEENVKSACAVNANESKSEHLSFPVLFLAQPQKTTRKVIETKNGRILLIKHHSLKILRKQFCYLVR